MRVIITEQFEKATIKLKNKQLEERLETIITSVLEVDTMHDIKNLEKLTGFKSYFRIRVGNYRIGLKIENNEVIFLDIGHRKEIYKRFP